MINKNANTNINFTKNYGCSRLYTADLRACGWLVCIQLAVVLSQNSTIKTCLSYNLSSVMSLMQCEDKLNYLVVI